MSTILNIVEGERGFWKIGGGEIKQLKSPFQASTLAPLNFTFADYLHENKTLFD